MHKTPEITRLIHDNCWTVLSFAFGQPALTAFIDNHFEGEWKFLRKQVFELGEIRADRALLEMATQLRVLDDEQQFSGYFRQVGQAPFGSVTQSDGSVTDLYFRDMTNKIIHAKSFEWNVSGTDDPTIICMPNDVERWTQADVNLIAVMAFVGGLMF